MTRRLADRLAAELAEPRKHDWAPVLAAAELRLACERQGCTWTWFRGRPEPTGCRGTDA